MIHRAAVLFFLFVSFCFPQAVSYQNVSSTTDSSCASGALCNLRVIPGTTVNVCSGSGLGIVNTAGTVVTLVSGPSFTGASGPIQIGPNTYQIQTVVSSSIIVLTTSAGTQNGVTYSTLSGCLAAPATTYTGQNAGSTCPTTAQLTPILGGSCTSTTDNQGNLNFWALAGTYYYYLTTPASAGGQVTGPYPLNIGSSTGCPSNATCDANYATLALANAAAGTGTLYVTRAWNSLSTQTLSAAIQMLSTGKIQPASGQVVTIAGPFNSPNTQTLDTSLAGAGGIVFSSQIGDVNPVWFGADPTFTSDSKLAIQSCIAAHPSNGTNAGNGVTTLAIRPGNCAFPSSGGVFGVSGTVYQTSLQRVTIPKGVTVKLMNGEFTSGSRQFVWQVLPTLQGSTPSPNTTQNVELTGGGTIDCNGTNNAKAAGVLFYGSEHSTGQANITNCVTGGLSIGQASDAFFGTTSDDVTWNGWITGISESGTNAPGIGAYIHCTGCRFSGPVQGFNGSGAQTGDCVSGIADPEICVDTSEGVLIEAPVYGECESSFLQDHSSYGTTFVGGIPASAEGVTGCPSSGSGLYAIYLSSTTVGFSTGASSIPILNYGIALYDASFSPAIQINGNASSRYVLAPYVQQQAMYPAGISFLTSTIQQSSGGTIFTDATKANWFVKCASGQTATPCTAVQLSGGSNAFQVYQLSSSLGLIQLQGLVIEPAQYTFASIPSALQFLGAEVMVTDSSVTTWGSNCAGGGTPGTNTRCQWDGGAWTVIGK